MSNADPLDELSMVGNGEFLGPLSQLSNGAVSLWIDAELENANGQSTEVVPVA